MITNVYGKKGLIYGDLHLSDRFTGRHRNYLANCFSVMADIEKQCMENNPSFIVFLGDLVGLHERNIKNREVLLQICTFFNKLSILTRGNVFVVKGNHDTGDFPEFQFLSGLGYFKTMKDLEGGFFDYYSSEEAVEPEIRFHLVDYGSEKRELDILCGNAGNIALGHNNYTIPGYTNWYNEHDGIELSRLSNFAGLDMLISGHIHNPSPDLIATEMVGGGSCSLFYPGCPTRPSADQGKYDSVHYMKFEYSFEEQLTNWDAVEFPLEPASNIFYPDDEFIDDLDEDAIEEKMRVEALHEVLGDILKCRMTSGNVFNQVRAIPNASDEAKDIACSYLKLAIDN